MSRVNAVSANDKTFQLQDGRALGYADYGIAEGKAVLYFHGYPGARLEAGFLAEHAVRAGMRLIGIDRPGMGLSSFKAGRHLLDWPDDVVELADSLHIDRFAVVGVSGGGPYALACAYKIPQRLTACSIVSGLGPLELGTTGMMPSNRLLFFLAQRLPWLLTPLLGSIARPFQDEEKTKKALAKMARNMVEPDRQCLLTSQIGEYLTASTVEAFRQGVKGAAYEGALYGRSWGFRLEDIAFNPLYLWHGGLDKNVPAAMGRAVAERLSGCKATYYPDDGHLSVIVNHREEILTALLS